MVTRGIRGATIVSENTSEAILRETRRLLALLIRLNGIDPQDVASATFTTTQDLDAEFPALAARQLGWHDTALLCGNEMPVPGALSRVVRILVLWNTTKRADEIVHVYMNGAEVLRPDRKSLPPVDFAELDTWISTAVEKFRK